MAKDRILLTGMTFYGYHGVLPWEREAGQHFVVDVKVESDLRVAGQHDDLEATVDYREIYVAVRREVEGPPHALLEALAEAIAHRLLALARVEGVTVRVRKPNVALDGPLESAGVEITRRRTDRAS